MHLLRGLVNIVIKILQPPELEWAKIRKQVKMTIFAATVRYQP